MTQRKLHLMLEFSLCFLAFPALLALFEMRSGMFAWLWAAALICAAWLTRHTHWSLKENWNNAGVKPVMRRVMWRFLVIGIILLIFTKLYDPVKLFDFPLQSPLGWVAFMFVYPVLSVFPQEIIFRSFFHRRYRKLFAANHEMIIASAITFGWAHIVMNNWVAVVFSGIGGLMFADTYIRSKSLAAACFEHALYGCYVFTIGLGWYFYHGNGGLN